jgi:hypothetical protein
MTTFKAKAAWRACVKEKARFVAAEVVAHVTLAREGRTTGYRRAERASEMEFNRARRRGCRWAK